MFDTKNIAGIIVFVIVIIVVCVIIYNYSNKNTPKQSNEGFGFGGLPSMTWKKDRIVASSAQAAAKGDFYSVPGTYQAILNPRFSNVDYGANIKYNLPSYDKQAVPCEPLTFGKMAKENFTDTVENYGCSSCNVSCRPVNHDSPTGASSYSMKGDYSNGNYNEVLDTAYQSMEYPSATDMMPVGDMTTVNALGETVQPIVYDRFIYANRNSRLRAQGDPIRGDLPIVPCSAEWFRPSVHPNIDLHEGAMNVLGGVDNSTTQALADLIYATSGDSTIAGVNMSSMRDTETGQAMSNVQVTAYP